MNEAAKPSARSHLPSLGRHTGRRGLAKLRLMALGYCLASCCVGVEAQSPKSVTAPQSGETQQSDSAQAATLIAAEKFQEAEAVLHKAIAAQPSAAEMRYLLGYTLLRENKPAESLAEYTAAARLRSPSSDDLKHVAMDYVLLGSYPDADRWIARSVKMNPQDADAWYVSGRIHYERKRYSDAVDDFKKVLMLTPQTVKAENNLGLAYEGMGRSDDAIAAYQRAIELQRDSTHPSEQPLLNLAILLIHQNDLDQALPLLTKATGIAPREPKIHEQLGQLYLRQNLPIKAQTEFQAALASTPDSAALHFLLGQAYRRQGLLEKAKAEFEKSSALSGTHSVAH